MTTDRVSSSHQVFAQERFSPLLQKRVIGAVTVWLYRVRSRRELAALSSLELRDIGYPAGVEAEKSKPFWRE